MEAGLASHSVAVGVEGDALLGDGGVEVDEGVEVLVDDSLVDVDPERLGRLQFGGIGRQIDEPDALGHGEAGFGVPAGAVEHQDDDAVAAGAGLAAKSARVPSKSSLSTPVERYQKLSPVAGETKVVT